MSSNQKLMELINARRAQSSRANTLKLESGRSRFRVLPSWRGGDDPLFFKDFGQHFLKDATNKVVAVYSCNEKINGTPCEVCQALQQAMTAADDDLTIKRLSDMKAGSRVLLNVLWFNNGGKVDEMTPQILEVPPSVLQGIKGAGGILGLFADYPNLLDLNSGTEIVIEKSGSGKENTTYTVTPVPATKQVSPEVLKKLHDLDAFTNRETEDSLRRAMTAVQNMVPTVNLMRLAAPVAAARPALTAPAAPAQQAIPASIASNLEAVQPAAVAAVEHVAPVASPAPAAPAQVAAPAANAPVSTGDDEIDKLLAGITQ